MLLLLTCQNNPWFVSRCEDIGDASVAVVASPEISIIGISQGDRAGGGPLDGGTSGGHSTGDYAEGHADKIDQGGKGKGPKYKSGGDVSYHAERAKHLLEDRVLRQELLPKADLSAPSSESQLPAQTDGTTAAMLVSRLASETEKASSSNNGRANLIRRHRQRQTNPARALQWQRVRSFYR